MACVVVGLVFAVVADAGAALPPGGTFTGLGLSRGPLTGIETGAGGSSAARLQPNHLLQADTGQHDPGENIKIHPVSRSYSTLVDTRPDD